MQSVAISEEAVAWKDWSAHQRSSEVQSVAISEAVAWKDWSAHQRSSEVQSVAISEEAVAWKDWTTAFCAAPSASEALRCACWASSASCTASSTTALCARERDRQRKLLEGDREKERDRRRGREREGTDEPSGDLQMIIRRYQTRSDAIRRYHRREIIRDQAEIKPRSRLRLGLLLRPRLRQPLRFQRGR